MEPPPPGGPPDAPGAKQPFANPDQIHATAASRATNRSSAHCFTSENIRIFRFQESLRPPSPRNVPLTRSSGVHPDDTRPKAKLRFPSTGMKTPPPMQIAPTPMRHVSVPISVSNQFLRPRPAVTPVMTLPGQGVKDKGFPADPDLEPENEPGSSSYDPPAVPGLPVDRGGISYHP